MSVTVDRVEPAELAVEFVGWDAQFRLCILLIAVFAGLACLLFLWLAWAVMALTV